MKHLTEFKKDCLKETSINRTVQKYIIDGESHFFSIDKTLDEYSFKRELADALKVHIRDIAIVGSGKLGFSVKPDPDTGEYLWNPFDHEGTNRKKSDLDVAIVSGRLFDAQIKRLHQLAKNDVKSFRTAKIPYLSDLALKGRLRPDSLPKDYTVTREVMNAKSNLESALKREVNFEIYKSWYYLESYHEDNLKSIKVNLEA